MARINRRIIQKDLHDPDNHDGVITHLEPDIMECKVKGEQASFNFMATVIVHSDFGAPQNKVCHCFHFSTSICHEVMGPGAMILVCQMLSFKPVFFTLIFHLHQEAL